MARRRYQRGTTVLRGKRDPVWVARWREDVIDSTGRVHTVRKNEVLGTKKSFRTKKLALRELEARLAHVNSPNYRGQRSATFREFADFWKKNVLSNKKPSTQYSVNSQFENHLLPHFGSWALKDINWQSVQEFINARDLAPKSRRNLIQIFKMIWKSAKAAGYVTHNPFEDLSLPPVPPSPPFFYTAEEAKKIIAEAEGQYKTLFWIAAETGVRAGELCALRIQDVDFDRLLINVRQSVWRDKFTTPKTANAIRSIPISEALGAHLRTYLQTWRPNVNSLLFSSPKGGPLHPCSVRQRILTPMCKRLGIAAKGLKAFRHGCASLMDRAGVPLKVRQERLGHAPGTKVTMTNYTHSVTEDARSAAAAVASMLIN